MIGVKTFKAIGIINHLKLIYPQRIGIWTVVCNKGFIYYRYCIYSAPFLISSHMFYGILLWSKSDTMDEIVALQKKVCVIYRKCYCVNTTSLYLVFTNNNTRIHGYSIQYTQLDIQSYLTNDSDAKLNNLYQRH